MKRLGAADAVQLPAGVEQPAYARERHGVGIVHLGLGAFHRAHQAAYVDRCLAVHGGDWRIRGVSLRSAGVYDQLAPQDGLYTLVERSEAGDRHRLIGAIADVLVAPHAPDAVIGSLAAPATRIVTLTVTEKGYCHDPATGRLDEAHPDIVHDLAHPERPRSAVGYLAAALARRRARKVAAPTLLCCDNLPDNGQLLHGLLTRFAELGDPELAEWIAAQVACPTTMVDRIVPATTPADLAEFAARTGFEDRALVKTEPFSQWVIEDRFAGERPAFEEAGAQIVADVRPFELAKLRMLNGAHSTLAYLGLRLGHVYVHQAIGDRALRRLIEQLLRGEAAPSLPRAAGLDPQAYADALLARFANPALEHRLLQIAMDGSQKLPQRLLGTIGDAVRDGREAPVAMLGVASWILHAAGIPAGGERHPVDDPLAEAMSARAKAAGTEGAALAAALLGMEAVFGDLGREPAVARGVAAHVTALLANPRGHVERLAAELPASLVA